MRLRLSQTFAALSLCALCSCAGTQRTLSPQALAVQVVDALPTDGQYEKIGPVEAALNSIINAPSDRKEALRRALRSRAAEMGADCVVLETQDSSSGLLGSFDSIRGVAWRRKGGAPPPPLPDVPSEPTPQPQQVAQAEQRAPPQSRAGAARIPPGKLAVLDFKSYIKDWEPEQARYFSDLVRSAAVRVGPQMEVITRENLLVLLQAAGKDLGQCEGQCEVETGRLIGADVIVSGDLQRIGKKLKLSLRLHETKGGRLLAAEVASGRDADELDQAAQDASALLLSGAR